MGFQKLFQILKLFDRGGPRGIPGQKQDMHAVVLSVMLRDDKFFEGLAEDLREVHEVRKVRNI